MNLPATSPRFPSFARSPLAEIPRLPVLPVAVTERLAEILATIPTDGGPRSICQSTAFTADERAWLEAEHLPAVTAALAPGTAEAVYARLERFSFGFGQLRGLDAATVQGTILNWQEAVEDKPLLAVDQACRAWNAGGFRWQKRGLVPNPDELARAVDETTTALRSDERQIRRVLALPVRSADPLPMLTAPGRPCSVAEALDEYRTKVVEAAAMPSPERDPTDKPERYSENYLAELRAREVRRSADPIEIPRIAWSARPAAEPRTAT